MAYWWVAQNHTFKEERASGLLWAPKLDKAHRTPHHWAALTQVQPGDLIFSFVNQAITAISVAKTKAYDHKRPPVFQSAAAAEWQHDGRRIDVDYRDVTPPLPIPPIASALRGHLPAQYSPLTSKGKGTQGYLFLLPPLAGRFLLDQIDGSRPVGGGLSVDTSIEVGIAASDLPPTVKKALIECRVGQGQFRKELIKYWSGRCSVTGLGLTSVLRASHIKPWRDSNNAERLAMFNGLLLSPTYDAMFDQGFISFDQKGRILLSQRLSQSDAKILGLSSAAQLTKLAPEHSPFLSYHRDVLLK